MINRDSSITQFNAYPANEKEAIEHCVMLNRILSNEEIVDMMGHVSVRNPVTGNTFFQSRRISPAVVTRADIMEFNLSGKIISKRCSPSYTESGCHGTIYKARPDVNAIVHCHCDDFIPFVCSDIPMRVVTHEGSIFYGGIRFMERLPGMDGCTIRPQEHEAMLDALGDRRAFFIKNHGVVLVGESTVSMVASSIYLKKNALALYRMLTLGSPCYLNEESAMNAAKEVLAPGMIERIWGYYLQRMRRSMPDLYW